MNNIITIVDDLNRVYQVEVLNIFGVEGYGEKEYVLYTKNEEINDEYVRVYVSILENDSGDFRLLSIENPKELADVTMAVQELEEQFA